MQNQHTRRGQTQEIVNAANQNKSHCRMSLSGIFNACCCNNKENPLLNGYVEDPRLQPLWMTALLHNNREAGDPRQNSSGMTANLINGKCTPRGFILRPSSSRNVGMRDIGAAHTLYPALQPCGVTKRVSHGFTLIELLVVVLIIGILAAVALPQYQKAVYKSRYATLKPLAEGLAQAQEIYYLANGTYTDKIEDLDIDIPEATDKDRTSNHLYRYDWGYCAISLSSAQCKSDTTKMQYQIYLQHAKDPTLRNSRRCIVWSTQDLNDLPNQVCKMETKATTGVKRSSENYTEWRYQ